MEGIVIKNIKERAREYADRHKAAEIVGKVYGYERIYNAEMTAYEKGATDQKAIEEAVTITKYDAMTEKQLDREECFTTWYFQNAKGAPTFSDAIEWARKQTIEDAKSAFNKACGWLSTYTWYNEVVEEFRKAMEE